MRVARYGIAAVLVFAASAQTDFRQTVWGMTPAQVRASETNRPNRERDGNREILLEYHAIRFGSLGSRLIYIFANNKLVRAKYIFSVEHEDPNKFIADYRTIEPVLIELHGKPTSARAIWEDDATQDEPKSYLDQDRATPASILPSDPLVGLAVSLGHLRLYTEWSNTRTTVLHALSGNHLDIVHQLEYRSVAFEPLENAVRRSSEPSNGSRPR
jgi:hypothetical protein